VVGVEMVGMGVEEEVELGVVEPEVAVVEPELVVELEPGPAYLPLDLRTGRVVEIQDVAWPISCHRRARAAHAAAAALPLSSGLNVEAAAADMDRAGHREA
jgi:hypothetical protein